MNTALPPTAISSPQAGRSARWSKPGQHRVWLAVALLVGVGLCWWGAVRLGWGRPGPLLTTPQAALEVVQGQTLYYNGLAWPWLREQRPELLRAEDRVPGSVRVRNFTEAVQNPRLFRQLDRQERFDTLLLVGAPSQYRPLLDHLLETRDWTLTYVDHTSLILQRGTVSRWEPSRLKPLRQRFAQRPARERATFLAQTASKLIAVREPAAARQLLEEAETLGAKVAEIPSVQAQYHLSRGEWREAIATADRALGIDKGDLNALGSKVQALYATKRYHEAYALSKQLLQRLPDDPAILFYHAKIAHDARAFLEEAKVLRHLITLAEVKDRPVSTYRVYLGQSLASAGEAQPALEEFRQAMEDPELPKEQRDFARDCVKLIHSQAKP